MAKSKISNKKIVGTSMLFVGVLMPLTQLPQIVTLYTTKVTTGLSLETWLMYLVLCCVPIIYGIVYKLPPLIISNVLWTIVNLVVIIGIIKFGVIQDSSSFETLIAVNSIGKFLSLMSLFFISSAFVLLSIDLLKPE